MAYHEAANPRATREALFNINQRTVFEDEECVLDEMVRKVWPRRASRGTQVLQVIFREQTRRRVGAPNDDADEDEEPGAKSRCAGGSTHEKGEVTYTTKTPPTASFVVGKMSESSSTP